MEFVETKQFTARVVALGLEEEVRRLQRRLLENPLLAPVDPGTGGLRKARLADRSRGNWPCLSGRTT